MFVWENYLYACGPCNGPKNDKFAVFGAAGAVIHIDRKTAASAVAPPTGNPVLVDPRRENPLDFLELDLVNTFEFVPMFGLSAADAARASYTVSILRLNVRDYLVRARQTAYGSYVARLKGYVAEKNSGASQSTLNRFAAGIKRMEHPTVWREMQRQHYRFQDLAALFAAAPEALGW